ncbi:MAG TPA: SxtJ family membrane protein [Isosphaeraceae bacterium]|jgi:hypothetical protein
MRWSDIPFSPSSRMLRQFAGLWLAFFGGFAVWQGIVRGRVGVAVALAALAFVIGGLGLIRPQLIRPIFVGWMVLAFPIGWTVSLVLLGLVYYGLFLPIGLVFRLIGRDALQLRPRPDATTYWTSRPDVADVRRYFRQF